MSKTLWIVLVAIVVIAGGALWWSSSMPAPTPVDQGAASSAIPGANDQGAAPDQSGGTAANISANVSATASAPMSATVSYNGSSFTPASVTISKGGTVKFVDTSGSMWVAANQHPSHTGYDGTSRSAHCAAGYSGAAPFDQCTAGSSFSFTFGQVGTWGYHDHMNAGAGGTVIVK